MLSVLNDLAEGSVPFRLITMGLPFLKVAPYYFQTCCVTAVSKDLTLILLITGNITVRFKDLQTMQICFKKW